MLKKLKFVSTMGALGLALIATSPALAQAPVTYGELAGQFWTLPMMKAMDSNKDGMVSRDEFITYMGAQYDRMDTEGKKRLNASQWTNRAMMAGTFPTPTPGTAN